MIVVVVWQSTWRSLGKQKSGEAKCRDITNDTTKVLGQCGPRHRTRATKRRMNADIVGREEDGLHDVVGSAKRDERGPYLKMSCR